MGKSTTPVAEDRTAPTKPETGEIRMRETALIGSRTFEADEVLAEVTIRADMTLAQLCAAIRHGKAGE